MLKVDITLILFLNLMPIPNHNAKPIPNAIPNPITKPYDRPDTNITCNLILV